MSSVLADQFQCLGHQVRVVTRTPLESGRDDLPYEVLRSPSTADLRRAVRWSDVVFHSGISLRFAWRSMPLLVSFRPWVVVHHIALPQPGRISDAAANWLKRIAFRFATNIAVSRAVAQTISVPAAVIPNPYDESLFVNYGDQERPRELLFLGRLVSDKGVSVLLDALAALSRKKIHPKLTIVGYGPEYGSLQRQVVSYGIEQQVSFVGVLRDRPLVDCLNQHQIIIVPSVWEEPFGIVALEGIACGLVPIVAQSGGLPEAIGPCGLIVPKSDANALANAIGQLLSDRGLSDMLRQRGPTHLLRHTRQRVAREYLDIIHCATQGRTA